MEDRMNKNIIVILLAILMVSGCGGGGGNGTKPIIMSGEANFNSASVNVKVALVTLDINDNWVTVSTSEQISHSGSGWDWADFSLDLPIVSHDSAYAIIIYADRNKNGKIDEKDDEILVDHIDYYAVYREYHSEWTVEDYEGGYCGQLPGYSVEIKADYYRSAEATTKTVLALTPKEVYKAKRLLVEGR